MFAPAVTVFDPVTGEVDVVAFRDNARAWLAAPLAGLVLFGSTGEGPLLDEDERTRLLAGTRELAADRLLLAGTGAESTRATIRLTRAAAEAGADAVLVQPPAYYKPQMTPEALRDHFLAVADAAPVPVVLYRVPPRYSGVELDPGLVDELSRHPNIIGIKDSSGDLKTIGAYADACDRSCTVLAGNGAMLYGALEAGARGGILAVALLAPRECTEIYRYWEAGDGAAAGALQERVAPVHRALVGRLGVAGIKAALDLLGLAGGTPRPPLKPLPDKERKTVHDALETAGLSGTSGVSAG